MHKSYHLSPCNDVTLQSLKLSTLKNMEVFYFFPKTLTIMLNISADIFFLFVFSPAEVPASGDSFQQQLGL